ncbi:integral membrane protein GPR137-like [Rhincodon typus]|uniref:integral membrane protein GPR137-like n=1 Tax=Rhincodon typus TaxID=259920 RepID=UPI00202DDB60|nr:integral membrane protein GPR137-like [Rhincodon typus]
MEGLQVMDIALSTVSPEPLQPAVPPSVTLGLTIVYTALYGLLFLLVYIQLWLVLHYRHKKFSYQTVFLFLCLLWAALRTTLFSFYFRDTIQANTLGPFSFWLLYCFPVCLQFFTLSLMNMYFAQVIMISFLAAWDGELTKGWLPIRLVFLVASLLFLTVNLTCALLVKIQHMETKTIVLVRVIINDSLFVACAITLAVCLYVIAKTSPSTSIYLESKGTSVCQTTAVGALVFLLYASRACYNLVAVMCSPDSHDSFDYGWYNVSDQADLMSNLGDKGYLVFGCILFFWELLPTALLVLFFRVRRPAQDLAGTGIVNGPSFASRSYFFDNPRQFEGDDCPWAVGSHSEQDSLSNSLQRNGWYGTDSSNVEPAWYEGVSQHTTAPLLFARDHMQGSSFYHTFYSTPQT